jgi:hypothetical protein
MPEEDKVKKFNEMVARAHRHRNPYTEDYGIGMEIIIENGRRSLEEARGKYGSDWKKVPLKEIFGK